MCELTPFRCVTLRAGIGKSQLVPAGGDNLDPTRTPNQMLLKVIRNRHSRDWFMVLVLFGVHMLLRDQQHIARAHFEWTS